jgi:integrase
MLQDFVDDLVAAGKSQSTIRNALLPLRAIYRRALQRGEVAANPTLKLALPAVRSHRERVPRADEAAALLAALPAGERGLWATALYAGLRMGELQALDWADIDLDHNLIRVERSWDRQTGYIEPKSRAGKRRAPVTQTLRAHLLNNHLQQETDDNGHVFPNRSGGDLHPVRHQPTRQNRLGRRPPQPDRPARMPPHLRRLHDRRRRQPQSAQHILPAIQSLPLSDLVRATGLTGGYLSQVRRGERVPGCTVGPRTARISSPGRCLDFPR